MRGHWREEIPGLAQDCSNSIADALELLQSGAKLLIFKYISKYPQTFNISHTLVGNKIVDHSDVVETPPVGTAPTTSSFLMKHLASMDWAKTTARRDEKHLSVSIWCGLY